MARWTESTWWNAERHAIQEAYPEALFYERWNDRREKVGVWKVIMDPIPSPEDASIILADLEDGSSVNVGPCGKVRHSWECEFVREQHRRTLATVRLSVRPFEVELEYPAELRGEAGPVHPKLRVLSPEVSQRTHPHLFYDHLTRDSWACPISAQDTTWRWDLGATVQYLDLCAIWLLKTEVWVATGGRVLPALGRWSVLPDPINRATSLGKWIWRVLVGAAKAEDTRIAAFLRTS